MKKHSHQAPRAAATTPGTAATQDWIKWMRTALANVAKSAPTTMMPFYDSELRELRVATIVVKRFTQASDAQEIILTVLQEQDWCRSIDDPVPVKDDQVAKQRLRMAVANLNRRQRVPLLHFSVIRQGTGVACQFRDDGDGDLLSL